MTEALRQYALPFAVWELRLYLNTHPDDCQALALYQHFCSYCGTCNYACVCEESGETTDDVLACMDRAACADTGNVADLLDEIGSVCGSCCAGEACPTHWTWIDGPWPWECGFCSGEGEA